MNYRAHPSSAFRDVAIGFTTGAVFWPVALGHASLAGVPLQAAMGTAVFPAALYAFMGSLPLLSVQSGTSAALCMRDIVDRSEALGVDPAEAAFWTAALVGLVHVLMGFFNTVFIAELFSQPLMRGRTAAAAALVMISQAKSLTGIVLPSAEDVPLQKAVATLIALPTAHGATCALSAVLILFLVLMRRSEKCVTPQSSVPTGKQSRTDLKSCVSVVPPNSIGNAWETSAPAKNPRGVHRVSTAHRLAQVSTCIARWCRCTACAFLSMTALTANLWILVAGSLAVRIFRDARIALIDRLEPPQFDFSLPQTGLAQIISLLPSAALVAFISFGSHLIVAERIRRPNDAWSPRRELFALGAGSLCAAVLGGMPVMVNLGVSQSLQRSTGRLATLANAATHALAFLLVAREAALQRLPACAIAVILVVEFAPLLLEVPKDFRHLFRQACMGARSWQSVLASDLGIYLAALLSPLVFGIIYGSVVSVALELLLAITRFAGAGYSYIGRVPGTQTYDEIGVEGSSALALPKVLIVRFSAPRWFGNVASTTRIARQERRASGIEVHCVVCDMRMVSFLDETAMVHYKREWTKPLGYKIIVTNTCALVRRQLKDCGLSEMLQQPDETLIDLHAAVLFAEQYVRSVEHTQVRVGVKARSISATGNGET